MSDQKQAQPVWWGEMELESGQSRRWSLAGLDLAISRQPQEWHVRTQRNPLQREDEHKWALRESGELEETPLSFCRYVFRQTRSRLSLMPQLADRSVVVRPLSPLFVPAGQETIFYVSTPVWITGRVEGSTEPIVDIPVFVPRETWFGPSQVKGMLCYATKVTGRTDLSHIPARPFRAVTAVKVRNQGNDNMPIERINIPAPYLAVHAAESGSLWTPTLSITRPSHGRQLDIRIESSVLPQAGTVTRLSPARRGSDEHALIRVFDNFFD